MGAGCPAVTRTRRRRRAGARAPCRWSGQDVGSISRAPPAGWTGSWCGKALPRSTLRGARSVERSCRTRSRWRPNRLRCSSCHRACACLRLDAPPRLCIGVLGNPSSAPRSSRTVQLRRAFDVDPGANQGSLRMPMHNRNALPEGLAQGAARWRDGDDATTRYRCRSSTMQIVVIASQRPANGSSTGGPMRLDDDGAAIWRSGSTMKRRPETLSHGPGAHLACPANHGTGCGSFVLE